MIPALSRYLLGGADEENATIKRIRLPGIDGLASGFTAAVMAFVRSMFRNKVLPVAVVGIVTLVAVAGTWRYLPKLEYLPEGNRNLVFGVIIPPPGYNLGTMTDIAEEIEGAIRPHWAKRLGPRVRARRTAEDRAIFLRRLA